MCSSMLSLKFFVNSKYHSAHSVHRDQRMHQVSGHLQEIKNNGLSGPKSGRGRLQEVVVY